MKHTILTLGLLAATISAASAASIGLSTTGAGSRVIDVVRSPQTGIVANFSLGTMTNEADFTTFSSFGTGTTGSTSAFANGVPNGTAVNNTAAAAAFRDKFVYVVFYTGTDVATSSFAGIYKSTSKFDATLSDSASQVFALSVTTFSTAINPSGESWKFDPATVNTAGITGSAGSPTPTARTGIVFDLGGAVVVPEPASATFLGLTVLGFLAQRRRK